jgi:hypothetical protein
MFEEISLGMCLKKWNITLSDIEGFNPDTPEKMVQYQKFLLSSILTNH